MMAAHAEANGHANDIECLIGAGSMRSAAIAFDPHRQGAHNDSRPRVERVSESRRQRSRIPFPVPTGFLMDTPQWAHARPLTDLPEFSLAEAPLRDSGVLLATTGDLDIATVPALRERLAAIAARSPRRLVLDLRGVSFIDSTALAALIHTN